MLSGCGGAGEGESRPIRILANIPSNAYVGVEYYYEVGIDGGDGTLNYSLSNAPDWLETDLVENPLRRSVVLRGIPGVTGVDDSVSVQTRSILSVTDGKSVETVDFLIGVSNVSFELVTASIEEGAVSEYPETRTDTNGNGVIDSQDELSPATICMVDAEGEPLFSEEDVEYFVDNQLNPDAWGGKKVHLAFLPVTLDQSFYVDVTAEFELVDQRTSSGEDYLETVQTEDGRTVDVKSGLLSFPAGETSCYLINFVVDDLTAEEDEGYSVALDITSIGGLSAEITTNSVITIEDNEPIVSFSVPKVSVSEQGGGRAIKVPVKINLDRPPEQTVTALFEVDASTGGDAEISGANADFLITPGSFEVQFAKGITEAVIYIEALDNAAGDDTDVDEFLTLKWEDTETVRASDSTLTVYANEWLDDIQTSLPNEGRVVEAYADQKANVYVGYSSVEASDSTGKAHVVQFRRVRNVGDSLGASIARGLDVAKSGVDIEFKDFAIDRYETQEGDEIIELVVLSTVDKVGAPVPAWSESGGTDILVQKYENVNDIGGFDLLWEFQIGTVHNDYAESLSLDGANNINIVGGTEGGFGGVTNAGGLDGFFVKLNTNGELVVSGQIGTEVDETYNHITPDGQSNVSTTIRIDRSDADRGDDIRLRSMAGEGEVRRTTEFGSTKDDLALAANSASRGMVVAGRTAGTIRLDVGHQGGFDAIVSYHRNLSEITALEQFGSDGNDEALDAKVADQQVYSSGYTEGEMFGTHNGGEDWWVARFDIVEDEELEQEVLSEVWKIQGGTSGNERLVRVAPTEFGKVFAIIEENVGGTIYMTIAPLSVVDGISLYAACRETLDGC